MTQDNHICIDFPFELAPCLFDLWQLYHESDLADEENNHAKAVHALFAGLSNGVVKFLEAKRHRTTQNNAPSGSRGTDSEGVVISFEQASLIETALDSHAESAKWQQLRGQIREQSGTARFAKMRRDLNLEDG